jgi:hypothetical protein
MNPVLPPRSLWRTRGPVNLGGGSGLYSENFEVGPGMPVNTVGLRQEGPQTRIGLTGEPRAHMGPVRQTLGPKGARGSCKVGFGSTADLICSSQVLRLVTISDIWHVRCALLEEISVRAPDFMA